MSFLTPLYLLGAALITVPIVLHWLRRDVAPQVPFTAVRLLQGSPIDRSRRRRLRDLLLLAARVLALLMLAASFARPYVVGARTASRSTIVAIDRSFSMSAPGRTERARTLARQAVTDADNGGDRVAVIAFDQRADVVAPPGPAADARVAIDQVQPGSDATRYAAAFDKAAELLADDRRGRVVLVTDLQRSGFDGGAPLLPDGVELVVRDAGALAGNVAVTDARVEPRRVVATVRNFGAAPREIDVRLETTGQVRAVRHVSVAPVTSTDVAFDGVAPDGAFDVAIDDVDGYRADNVRYGVSTPRVLPRVLIVGGAARFGSGFYFSRALQAGGEDGADFDVRVVTGPIFAALSAVDLRQQAVVALLSTQGVDRRVRETLRPFLESGGGVFIAAGPDVDASVLSAVFGWTSPLKMQTRSATSVLAATDLRHPIFRPFDAVAANLGQVSVQRLWQLDPGEDWQVIARYTDGAAALVERAMGPGRVLLFTSDVDRRWNSFPVSAAFVPFVQESVRYLGAHPSGTSSILVSDVPPGIPPTPGVVQVGGRSVVVNVDPRESTVDRVSLSDFLKLVGRSSADGHARVDAAGSQAEARQNYWQYGLLLMLGALIAESFVGAR